MSANIIFNLYFSTLSHQHTTYRSLSLNDCVAGVCDPNEGQGLHVILAHAVLLLFYSHETYGGSPAGIAGANARKI